MNGQAPGCDEHHIEALVVRRQVRLALEKCGGRTGDALLLASGDGLGCRCDIAARLHLDEGDDAPAHGDDVELPDGMARAPRQDAPTA